MQQQYGTTMKSLRLQAERENLHYVLANAELTEEEQSALKDRLTIVEDELIQEFTANVAA